MIIELLRDSGHIALEGSSITRIDTQGARVTDMVSIALVQPLYGTTHATPGEARARRALPEVVDGLNKGSPLDMHSAFVWHEVARSPTARDRTAYASS
jgi:hypothetical protein